MRLSCLSSERIVAGSFHYSLPGGVFRYHSRAVRPLLFFSVWLFEKQSNVPVRRIFGSTFVEKECRIPGGAAFLKVKR